MDPLVPFQPGDNGFHHPDIGHAGGSAAMCPMRLPATGAPVLLLREHRGVVMALADRRFSIAVGAEYVTIGSAYRSPEDLPKLDPPATTTIRRPLGAVFGERAVERYRAPLEHAADTILNGLTGPFDLARDYCEPVIAEAVAISTGIPHDEWSHVLELTGQCLGMVGDAAEADTRTAAWHALYDYAATLIARRPDGLVADAITALTGAGLTPDTVLHTVATVVVGLGTPTSVLAISALELTTRPETVAECLADPRRWPATVNELMRYRANFALALPRVALTDVRISDSCVVRRGQVVVPSLLAAAHDPARTTRPAAFDPHQDAARNIVFGAGPHLCPGAALGRQWLVVGLHRLFARLPGLRLTVPPTDLRWQDGTLPVPDRIPVTG